MLCNRVEDHIRENKFIWCLTRKQIGKSNIYQFNIRRLFLCVRIKRKKKSFCFPKAKKKSVKKQLSKTQMKKNGRLFKLRLPNTTIFFNCKQLVDMYIQIDIYSILFILKSERLHVNKVSTVVSLRNGYITNVMLWKHIISTKCCVQVLTKHFQNNSILN